MPSSDVPSERQTEDTRVLDRLLSLKREGESDAAFARRLGLQPQHLSNYRSGRHTLSLRTAVRVARAVDLSLDWLLLGRGEPFQDRDVGGEGYRLEEDLVALSDAFHRKVETLAEEELLPEAEAEQIRTMMSHLRDSLEKVGGITAS